MNAALDRVLARLPNVRKTGSAWSARCPAHDDRGPSLSIREGRSGVLIRCFAGSFAEIVTALGLTVADLFNEPRTRETQPRPQRPPTAAEVKAALKLQLARVMDEERERLGYSPPVLSRHVNRARQAVNRLLGVNLRPVAPAWHEHAQHSDDPLWQPFAERALQEVVRERHGLDTLVSAAIVTDRIDAEDLAAQWLHAEARRELHAARIPGAA